MSIITRTRPEVKPTRRTVKTSRRFGEGILPSYPTFVRTWTDEDEAWAAQTFGAVDSGRRPTADEILHAGSDPRHCSCVGCVEGRTACYAGSPEDRGYDFRAAESAAMDRLERGLIPPDAADYISRTTLVGHPA